jgi:putative phage-type endonuclease
MRIKLEQGSEEWFKFRKDKIGGSDIPAIMGVSPHKTRTALMQEKLGKETQLTDYTRNLFKKGHEVEEMVRNSIAMKFEPAVFVHDQNDRLIASLDGISESGEHVLEVKYTTSRETFESVRSGDIPPHFKAQCVWNCAISKASSTLLVVVYAGISHSVWIQFDQSQFEEMKLEAERFLSDLDSLKSEGVSLVEVKEIDVLETDRIYQLKLKMKQLDEALKILKEEHDTLASALLEKYKARKIESAQISIQVVTRAGAIDYSKVPELKGVNLEQYRKKDSKSIRVDIRQLQTNEQQTKELTHE